MCVTGIRNVVSDGRRIRLFRAASPSPATVYVRVHTLRHRTAAAGNDLQVTIEQFWSLELCKKEKKTPVYVLPRALSKSRPKIDFKKRKRKPITKVNNFKFLTPKTTIRNIRLLVFDLSRSLSFWSRLMIGVKTTSCSHILYPSIPKWTHQSHLIFASTHFLLFVQCYQINKHYCRTFQWLDPNVSLIVI